MIASQEIFGSRSYLHYLEQAAEYEPLRYEREEERIQGLLDSVKGLSPAQHIPKKAIAYAVGLSIVTDQPFAVLNHEESYTVREKADILTENSATISAQMGDSDDPKPLKTLTLRLDDRYILLSGVGDFYIDKKVKRNLSTTLNSVLGTERNFFKHGMRINPEEFNPRLFIGAEHGIVGPFLRSASGLTSVCYYRDGLYTPVAIAVSLRDTLIVSRPVFNLAMLEWISYHPVPFRQV